ncbi:MAG TPA: flagellar biosynthetic protein FliR [Fibrobacteria bacterium]|nr:flagellar biosynthetic protein FliR [Fibrobacteria bacterium]
MTPGVNPFSGVPTLGDFTVVQIELWLFVLLRVSMLVFLMPILATDEVPARLKAALSFFLSLILFPLVGPAAVEAPASLGGYFLLAIREVYIGLVMGFAGTFVFAALRFAGSWIDQETGFASVQLFNPMAQEEDTPMGHLLFLIFIMLLLSTGGYAFWLQAMSESFRIIPLTSAQTADPGILAVFVRMSSHAFLMGVKIAAPLVSTLFLSSIALALVARIMPQMNVWLVGMPMKLVLGMLTMMFALPLLWQAFLRGQEGIQAYSLALMRFMGT